ncbi:MAG: hypothetical protein M9920_15180 [Verrucomicrobiae bacterium]|nr:hypothetical protein [Verrucomicrobiae bacterium]
MTVIGERAGEVLQLLIKCRAKTLCGGIGFAQIPSDAAFNASEFQAVQTGSSRFAGDADAVADAGFRQ